MLLSFLLVALLYRACSRFHSAKGRCVRYLLTSVAEQLVLVTVRSTQ